MNKLFFHDSSSDDESSFEQKPKLKIADDEIPKEFRLAQENISFCSFPGIVQSSMAKYWTSMFHDCLATEKKVDDDMIFYVSADKNAEDIKITEPPVFVRRIGASNCPPSNAPYVDWERTHLLNTLTRQLNFKITACVCHNETESANNDCKILHRVHSKVYASPMNVKMRQTTDTIEIGWPDIHFSIADYEDLWSNIILSGEGDFLIVDLAVEGELYGINLKNVSLFRGALGYKKVNSVYDFGTSSVFRSLYNGFGKVMSTISRSHVKISQSVPGVHYASIVGPKDIGKVDIAISKENDKLVCRPSSLAMPFENLIENLFKQYEKTFLELKKQKQ